MIYSHLSLLGLRGLTGMMGGGAVGNLAVGSVDKQTRGITDSVGNGCTHSRTDHTKLTCLN